MGCRCFHRGVVAGWLGGREREREIMPGMLACVFCVRAGGCSAAPAFRLAACPPCRLTAPPSRPMSPAPAISPLACSPHAVLRRSPPSCPPACLQNLMEKAVVLGVGVNRHTASEALSGGAVALGARLASQPVPPLPADPPALPLACPFCLPTPACLPTQPACMYCPPAHRDHPPACLPLLPAPPPARPPACRPDCAVRGAAGRQRPPGYRPGLPVHDPGWAVGWCVCVCVCVCVFVDVDGGGVCMCVRWVWWGAHHTTPMHVYLRVCETARKVERETARLWWWCVCLCVVACPACDLPVGCAAGKQQEGWRVCWVPAACPLPRARHRP